MQCSADSQGDVAAVEKLLYSGRQDVAGHRAQSMLNKTLASCQHGVEGLHSPHITQSACVSIALPMKQVARSFAMHLVKSVSDAQQKQHAMSLAKAAESVKEVELFTS